MTDEEELSIGFVTKKHLNVDKLWSKIEEQILTKLDAYLENSWLKYLLKLLNWMKRLPFYCVKTFNGKNVRLKIFARFECCKLYIVYGN